MQTLTRRHLYLYNCLKRIDDEKPVDLSSLNKRIEFQKKVYLMEALGVPLDFSFGSYLKGPYSSSLAEIGFSLYEMPNDSIPHDLDSVVPIDESTLEKIQIINNLINELPKDKIAYWLELISSLHFLKTQAYPPVGNIDDLRKRLGLWKPTKFSDEDVEHSIEFMRKYEFID